MKFSYDEMEKVQRRSYFVMQLRQYDISKYNNLHKIHFTRYTSSAVKKYPITIMHLCSRIYYSRVYKS